MRWHRMEILLKIYLQTENWVYKINIYGRDREIFLVKVEEKKTNYKCILVS